MKPPGLAVYHGRSITHEGDGSASPGDFVSVNGSGQVTQASDTSGPVVGVLSDTNDDTHDAGDMVSVETGGVVIANVASGTASGAAVAGTATAGEAGSAGTGAAAGSTLSAEGGSYRGASLDTGYAAVFLG